MIISHSLICVSPPALLGNLVDFLKAAEGTRLTIYKLLDMAAQVWTRGGLGGG